MEAEEECDEDANKAKGRIGGSRSGSESTSFGSARSVEDRTEDEAIAEKEEGGTGPLVFLLRRVVTRVTNRRMIREES